jgi:hypothetical protein
MAVGRLKRGADGTFADGDIARTLIDAMVEPAAAFGARGTPEWMRVVGALLPLSNRPWHTHVIRRDPRHGTIAQVGNLHGTCPWHKNVKNGD